MKNNQATATSKRAIIALRKRKDASGTGLSLDAHQPGGEAEKPDEAVIAGHYLQALERSHQLYRETRRKGEQIEPCHRCAIRHFCGSSCPAEAWSMHGHMDTSGVFCELYEELVRFAMRMIADGNADDFLEDGLDNGAEAIVDFSAPSCRA